MPVDAAEKQNLNVRPVIPDYDRIFREPLVAPEPQTYHQDFFSSSRDVIWWAVIFLAIGVSAAVLLAWESRVMADPDCGG